MSHPVSTDLVVALRLVVAKLREPSVGASEVLSLGLSCAGEPRDVITVHLDFGSSLYEVSRFGVFFFLVFTKPRFGAFPSLEFFFFRVSNFLVGG